MDYKIISPVDIKENVVDMICNEWMLIAAGDSEKFNMMTASWGSLGEMWSRHVAQMVIRPQRYTKEFVDKKDYFTLNFFGCDKAAKDIHKICGSKSGRDIDKAAETGLEAIYDSEYDTVYFNGARLVLFCKKLYAAPFNPECFIDKAPLDTYANKDYHTQYFGEIVKALAVE